MKYVVFYQTLRTILAADWDKSEIKFETAVSAGGSFWFLRFHFAAKILLTVFEFQLK